jgi:hypothetical protein
MLKDPWVNEGSATLMKPYSEPAEYVNALAHHPAWQAGEVSGNIFKRKSSQSPNLAVIYPFALALALIANHIVAHALALIAPFI